MNEKSNFVATKIIPGILLLLLVGILSACDSSLAAPTEPTAARATSAAPNFSGKKILWVDSYHQGYEWADAIQLGIEDALKGTGAELKIVHLDTKRNPDQEFGEAAGLAAKREIDTFKPDVVIATDDNAQIFVVVPYLKDQGIPVVFAGVNWDASIYGYPASNVTGMVEVELPIQLVNHLKQYSQGDRVGFIAIDAETEQKIAGIYNERFFDGQMKTYWAKSWADFKEGFLKLQSEVDIVIVSNNAGAADWNQVEAAEFFNTNTKVPTGSINNWMAPYALLVLGKSGDEQGRWAAQAALEILDGTPVSELPIVENKLGKLIINLDIAETLDIAFSPSLLKNAEVYTQKRVSP